MDVQGADTVAAVVIGRNEGERLRRCLESVLSQVNRVVYVDSGSEDNSPDLAHSMDVHVVRLRHGPYTAARGRQVGFEVSLQNAPQLDFVQFVDGDCVLQDNWIAAGVEHLQAHRTVAAVFGRRREERCNDSFYSRLMDIDWDIPVGETAHFTGDGLVRVEALQEVGGWSTSLVAGEEPDLCFRMCDRGWRIVRLPYEMSLHDATITRFAQYWRRAIRSGHAYAEVGLRHRQASGKSWFRMMLSLLCYGAVLPAVSIGLGIAYWPLAWLTLLPYLRLLFVMTRYCRRKGSALDVSLAYAFMNTLGKFAGTIGVFRYLMSRLLGRRTPLIEYKLLHATNTCKIREHRLK